MTADISGEVIDCWSQDFRTDEGFKYQGRMLYVVPERSAEEQPRFFAMGKTRRLVESYVPDKTKLSFEYRNNFKVLYEPEGAAKFVVLCHNKDHKPHFTDKGAELLGRSKEQLIEELETL